MLKALCYMNGWFSGVLLPLQTVASSQFEITYTKLQTSKNIYVSNLMKID